MECENIPQSGKEIWTVQEWNHSQCEWGGRGVPPPRRIGGEGGLRAVVFDESTRFVVVGTRYEPTKIG